MKLSRLKITILIVKLNNPLMGTETYGYAYVLYYQACHEVKLNNPQMGTETHIINIFKYRQDFLQLN